MDPNPKQRNYCFTINFSQDELLKRIAVREPNHGEEENSGRPLPRRTGDRLRGNRNSDEETEVDEAECLDGHDTSNSQHRSNWLQRRFLEDIQRLGGYIRSPWLPAEEGGIIGGICGQFEIGDGKRTSDSRGMALDQPDGQEAQLSQEELRLSEGGTLHFQGYLELRSPQRLSAIRKLGGDWARAHYETRQGARDQAVRYCTEKSWNDKDKGRQADPEWWPNREFFHTGKQGRRGDLTEVSELIKAGATKRSIAEKCTEAYIKYHRGIERAIGILEAPAVWTPFPHALKEWQQCVLDSLKLPVHPRRIYWFFESKGGVGKSTFALWLGSSYDCYYTTGGKHDRIYHAYEGQSIVVFDFARTVEEAIPYGVLENLKNGVAPRMYGEKTFFRKEKPHMFVFANFRPDSGKVSEDRFNIVDISE